MAIRFAIRNTADKASKESDGTIIRYSGTAEPFRRSSEREAIEIGVDGKGEKVLKFTTGLDKDRVDFLPWYSDEEKAVVKETIDDLRPFIEKFYGGNQVIQENNWYFWGKKMDVNKFILSHEDIDKFYDTGKSAAHALLYLSIISGAFIDLVAPTREWAEKTQTQHYLAIETDAVFDEDEDVVKSDAHAALAELRKEASTDALFILAWCIQYDTTSFGAYLKSTPFKDLVNYHIKYIDGKLVSKRKKNTPKNFLEYYEKWKGQQTKPLLYTEAYVKAGEYYNFLNQREKRFTTPEGTILGATVEEAVKNLHKPKFQLEYEKLRDQVEAKWKE